MYAGFACLLLAGCYEIPPELPHDDGAPEVPSPTPVYDSDPFAPENLWFERAFKLADEEPEERVESRRAGRPTSGTAEPFAPADELEVVDVAELTALSEAVLEEPLPEASKPGSDGESIDDCRARIARLIFQCDALALEAALGATDSRAGVATEREARSPITRSLDSELLRALERVSVRLFDESPAVHRDACWLEPPPIRASRWGEWTDADVDLPLGLLPSSSDLRWTQVLRARDSQAGQASALLRLRVSRDSTDAFSLLPLASECWVLEREGERVTATVWRFDRDAWLARGDPWRQLAPEEEFSIRDPLVENGEWLTGTTESLCLGCHGDEQEGPPAPRSSTDHEAQLARVREILRE